MAEEWRMMVGTSCRAPVAAKTLVLVAASRGPQVAMVWRGSAITDGSWNLGAAERGRAA